MHALEEHLGYLDHFFGHQRMYRKTKSGHEASLLINLFRRPINQH